jgi:ABC-type tungstate transport system permease subunit
MCAEQLKHLAVQSGVISSQAQEAGINGDTVKEVLKVGQFAGAASIDPVEVCALLITTVTLDAPGLLDALTQVFGDARNMDVQLCSNALAALGKYDERWRGDVIRQLEEGSATDGTDKVSYDTLMKLPAVKSMIQTPA